MDNEKSDCNKFKSNFITSLEEREVGDSQNKFKAKLLSKLISSEKIYLKDLLKDTLEKIIITAQKKKLSETVYFKNTNQVIIFFVEL